MHSTTECTVGTDIVISMENMACVLSVDQEQLTVTVQGGVTLRQLCAHLKKFGLQPPVVLEWGHFQIGAISGTHANDTSMRRSAQFSSFVLGVKLVTPTGKTMEISGSQNAEYLPAIRSHFGMLGVVCEVTLWFVNLLQTVSFLNTAQVGGTLSRETMTIFYTEERFPDEILKNEKARTLFGLVGSALVLLFYIVF